MNLAVEEEILSRIIEMAWEDRTPFEAIQSQFGLSEAEVKQLMRQQLSRRAYVLWRDRVNGRRTKHAALRHPDVSRAHAYGQYKPRSR